MHLTKEQWLELDKRMGVLFNEAYHLISDTNDNDEHYEKYIELLSKHAEIPEIKEQSNGTK